MHKTSPTALRAIAVYKLFKAAGLLLVAIAAFGLAHTPWFDATAAWVAQLPIQTGRQYWLAWVDTLLDLGPQQFHLLGISAGVYASLFIIEGWGLWHNKRWAEYLTFFATLSLIPIEIWETLRRVTLLKIIVLTANLAIVIYLWWLLRRERTVAKRS